MENMADKLLTPEEKQQNAQIMSTVKAWLELKEVKQVDIVECLNVSTATVSKWVNGAISPKISQLQQIANILKIDLSTLLTNPSQKRLEESYKEVKSIAQKLDDTAYQSWIAIGKQLTK